MLRRTIAGLAFRAIVLLAPGILFGVLGFGNVREAAATHDITTCGTGLVYLGFSVMFMSAWLDSTFDLLRGKQRPSLSDVPGWLLIMLGAGFGIAAVGVWLPMLFRTPLETKGRVFGNARTERERLVGVGRYVMKALYVWIGVGWVGTAA